MPWIALALLVPDLFLAGYLRGTRPGAQLYNIAHSTALPACMVGLGWWQIQPLVLALGLTWLAHIGMDRLLGYGLKYDDHFQHTHLGIQAPRDGSHARERSTAMNVTDPVRRVSVVSTGQVRIRRLRSVELAPDVLAAADLAALDLGAGRSTPT
jgi:Domain of unknown function (DUF4260)